MRTRKIMLGIAATAAIAAPIAVAGSANAAGAPVTQTSTVMVPTSDTTVDLPALNSQFTKMTLSITGGNSMAAAYNAHINELYLVKRFPLDKVPLRKCAGT